MMTELGLKPYRPQLLHALNEDDLDRQCEFARIFLNALAEDSSLLDRVVWTDEAILKLNGHVNRHNCVCDATENPHTIMTQEMNSPGITVWVGIWVGGIIGPFFFYGGNVNTSSYLEMLQREIVLTIEREMDLEEVVYMHDGAPAHYARVVRHDLDETFPDRWIGRRGWMNWPARSPDLTRADFFRYGLWSKIVYTQTIVKVFKH
jgi:hypothetical protein